MYQEVCLDFGHSFTYGDCEATVEANTGPGLHNVSRTTTTYHSDIAKSFLDIVVPGKRVTGDVVVYLHTLCLWYDS
jgi:hypothetical protein